MNIYQVFHKTKKHRILLLQKYHFTKLSQDSPKDIILKQTKSLNMNYEIKAILI